MSKPRHRKPRLFRLAVAALAASSAVGGVVGLGVAAAIRGGEAPAPAAFVVSRGTTHDSHQAAKPPAYAPCQEEDGSGQAACRWDAGSSGNGYGLSFVFLRLADGRGAFVYDGHKAPTAYTTVDGDDS